MKHKLADAVYDGEIERMSTLAGFPHLPKAQLQVRRALRRVTTVDARFLHLLVSEIVDTAESCPAPKEIEKFAERLRSRRRTLQGKSDCATCQGSGFITVMRQVALPGIPPYESEFAAVCICRGGKTPV